MGWWHVQPCEEEDYSSDSSESSPNVKHQKEDLGVGGNQPDDDDEDEEGLDEGLLAAANGKMSGMSGNILEEEDDDEEEGEGMSAAGYEQELQCQESRARRWGQYTGKIPDPPAHLSSSFCARSSSTNQPSTFKEATSQVASPIKRESASLREEKWVSRHGDEE